ncbi:MAG TPA: class I adenylate-forming enzyme family protein, partial [Caulobacteraceae bacterium]
MIVDRIYDWAHAQPTRIALINNDEVLTYSQFARAIARMRLFFGQQSLPVGQTAIVLINNLRDAWLSILSIRTLGLNTIIVKSISDAESLNINDVACIVVSQSERSHHKLAGYSLAGVKVVTIPAEAYIVSRLIPTRDVDSFDENGHILYTSGSTGANKKLLLDGLAEDSRNAERARFQRFSRDTVYYGASFPLSTAMGFKCPSAVWHAGGCVVLNQISDGYGQLSRHKVTCAGVSVPILKEILRTAAASDMAPLQFELMIGGGALPAGLAKMAAEKLTPKVSNYYAATEFGTPMMQAELGIEGELDWMRPVDGVTVQIVDDSGDERPVGREGHLRFQLREIDCSAYLDDAEAS